MTIITKLICVPLLFVVLTNLQQVLASHPAASLVYDSITGGNFNGGDFLGANIETGQVVNLAGTARTLTKFEINLTGGNPAPFDAVLDYRIHFRNLDGPSDVPGTAIWSSSLMSINLPARMNHIAEVEVPMVVVPGTFAWTLEDVAQINSAGIPFVLGAHIGTSGGFVQKRDPSVAGSNEWRRTTPPPGAFNDGFGVRFTAVPEPASEFMFCFLGLIFLPRRR